MEKEVIQFLQDVRAVLCSHQACSISEYPASGELAQFLTMPEQIESSVLQQASAVHEKSESRVVKPVRSGSNADALAEIAAEVGLCKSCGLAGQRTCVAPGKGGGGTVRLLLVGHWLSVPAGAAVPPSGTVFGVEEDQMLERMLAAIHLRPEDVLVTNLIKCGVGPEIQPQAEHIDICLSYLQRQIKAVAPELICTMGMVTTRTMLRLSQPLSRLRGRIHLYQGPEGEKIPLLPTFHPSYLLQNPEMKKATWQDLQVLERQIASPSL